MIFLIGRICKTERPGSSVVPVPRNGALFRKILKTSTQIRIFNQLQSFMIPGVLYGYPGENALLTTDTFLWSGDYEHQS